MDLGFIKSCLDLKIKLDKFCEGFTSDKTSKVATFSTKLKILMLLKQGKSTPKQLIESLAIAKSNITIICDGMVGEKLIEKIKNEQNRKYISYKLTQKGEQQLNIFVKKIGNCYPQIEDLPNVYDIEYKIREVSDFFNIALEDEDAKNI